MFFHLFHNQFMDTYSFILKASLNKEGNDCFNGNCVSCINLSVNRKKTCIPSPTSSKIILISNRFTLSWSRDATSCHKFQSTLFENVTWNSFLWRFAGTETVEQYWIHFISHSIHKHFQEYRKTYSAHHCFVTKVTSVFYHQLGNSFDNNSALTWVIGAMAWDHPSTSTSSGALLIIYIADIMRCRYNMADLLQNPHNGPLARYAKLRVRMRLECRERFPRPRR